ncbi:MAG TPA: acyltransferase [Sphingomicrobium sp.]|nr:acyltransferase [Sphingomicrobium sp.]
MSNPAVNSPELTTVRGIACVALVAYHVVGPTSASGMHLPDSSQWHHAMNSFNFFRMPLFSVISGFVYAGRRVERHFIAEFLKKKSLRLGAPLLFVTAVMLGLRRLAYGDSTSAIDAFGFHYQHLWFIQALLIIFIGVAVCDSFGRLNSVGLLCLSLASLVLSQSFDFVSVFSLNGALYLAPFFIFGMILRAEPTILQSRNYLPVAAWFVAIGFVLQQAGILGAIMPVGRLSLAAALCGCGAAYAIFAVCPRIAFLESIGAYSYTIYLWHPIAAASVRLAVNRYTALPSAEEFLLLVAAGLVVPIIIHRAVERIPLLSLLIAGIRLPHRRSVKAARLPALVPAHRFNTRSWSNDNSPVALNARSWSDVK